MTDYYVTLCWTVSHTARVSADSPEEAEDAAICDADSVIALYGGRNDLNMDVSEPYVEEDGSSVELAE